MQHLALVAQGHEGRPVGEEGKSPGQGQPCAMVPVPVAGVVGVGVVVVEVERVAAIATAISTVPQTRVFM